MAWRRAVSGTRPARVKLTARWSTSRPELRDGAGGQAVPRRHARPGVQLTGHDLADDVLGQGEQVLVAGRPARRRAHS